MSERSSVVVEHDERPLLVRKYVVGFVGSVAITLLAYFVVVHGTLNHLGIETLLAVLAMAQFVLQLVFFLHIGAERKPRWKLLVLFFMIGTVLIVVAGSIWIMNNLNYRMTPGEVTQYLQKEDAF